MPAIEFKRTDSSFCTRFRPCTRKPASWKEEMRASALAIASRADRPLWLCSSGGIDSEVMCHAFFDQGINFSVLTLRHASGTNEHDIAYARNWCRKHGVHQKIVSVDMENFFRNEIPAYLQKGFVSFYLIRYLQIKLMEIAESLGGIAVIAGGEQYYDIDREKVTLAPDDIFLEFNAGYKVPFDWIERNTQGHVPYFMFSTPELCLSYLRLPANKFALQHPDVFRQRTSVYTLKRLVFQWEFPLLKPRPKYHGYEKILSLTKVAKGGVRAQYGKDQIYRLPVVEFEKQLSVDSKY